MVWRKLGMAASLRWRQMAKPQTLEEVMADAGYLDLRTPAVTIGDAAPDFELPLVDGDGSLRLAELNADRPVALVFGSYT
jgi:hypothetical protein